MATADDDWEWADETGFFCDDLRDKGCAERPESWWSSLDAPVYDAMIFAIAVAEDRSGTVYLRSRGPGRRIRDRYWDERH